LAMYQEYDQCRGNVDKFHTKISQTGNTCILGTREGGVDYRGGRTRGDRGGSQLRQLLSTTVNTPPSQYWT